MHIFVKIYPASNATGVFRQKPQGGGFFFVVSLATNKHESVEVSIYQQFKVYSVQYTYNSYASVKISSIDYEIPQIGKG